MIEITELMNCDMWDRPMTTSLLITQLNDVYLASEKCDA
jgi:hypothetical protein